MPGATQLIQKAGEAELASLLARYAQMTDAEGPGGGRAHRLSF